MDTRPVRPVERKLGQPIEMLQRVRVPPLGDGQEGERDLRPNREQLAGHGSCLGQAFLGASAGGRAVAGVRSDERAAAEHAQRVVVALCCQLGALLGVGARLVVVARPAFEFCQRPVEEGSTPVVAVVDGFTVLLDEYPPCGCELVVCQQPPTEPGRGLWYASKATVSRSRSRARCNSSRPPLPTSSRPAMLSANTSRVGSPVCSARRTATCAVLAPHRTPGHG